MKYRLIISYEMEEDSEEAVIEEAKWKLREIKNNTFFEKGKSGIKLTRDGDRSGGNLLLPKLQGRFGNHYQGRKATIEEIIEDE